MYILASESRSRATQLRSPRDRLVAGLQINLHCADIKEFNPDQAIGLWNKASIRGR